MSMRWIGVGGTALVVVAYVPQLVHLVRARCAGGISLRAYAVWTTSAALLLVYAISAGDTVFTILQSYQLLAASSISLLSLRRRATPCSAACGRALWVPPVGARHP
jgi:uncharacterized protein with PQ loop repeat